MRRVPLAAAMVLVAGSAWAHGFLPARLELRALGQGRYAAAWAVPLAGEGGEEGRTPVSLSMPTRCRAAGDESRERVDLRVVSRRTWDCGPTGLRGATLRVDGLDAARVDAFVRVVDGADDFTAVLRADAPSVEVPARPQGWRAVAGRYLGLGVEHILTGWDHLLFVLGLVLLVGARRALLGVITAFTLSHSLTLALTALGLVRLPQAPVEACIALSIAALARALTRPDRAAARPWAMAGGFGLLHGFGFAGALADEGVPAHEIPAALGAFNVGVELGQLAFVATALALGAAAARCCAPSVTERSGAALPWAMGAVAMFWVFDRVTR